MSRITFRACIQVYGILIKNNLMLPKSNKSNAERSLLLLYGDQLRNREGGRCIGAK